MRQDYGLQFRFDFDRFFRLGVGFRFQRVGDNGLMVPDSARAMGDHGGDTAPQPAREEYCVCCPDGSMDCRYPYDCRGPYFSPLLTMHGLITVSGEDVDIDRMRLVCMGPSNRDAFPNNTELPQADALRRIFPRLESEHLRDMGSRR